MAHTLTFVRTFCTRNVQQKRAARCGTKTIAMLKCNAERKRQARLPQKEKHANAAGYGPRQYGPDWERLGPIASGMERNRLPFRAWNHPKYINTAPGTNYQSLPNGMALVDPISHNQYGPNWSAMDECYYGWVRIGEVCKWMRRPKLDDFERNDIDPHYPCVYERLVIHCISLHHQHDTVKTQCSKK